MNAAHPSETDLRLLRMLDALLESGSVARAADRLGVTPSAVSHALKALRLHFRDPLFVRSGAGFRPTPLALALGPTLREGMTALSKALAQELAFDPATSERTFTIATPDYPLFTALPQLIADLRVTSPKIDVRIFPLGSGLRERLLVGSLDVVLAGGEVEASLALDREVMRTLIISEPFMCVMRPDHPAAAVPVLTLDAYLSSAHLLVSTTGGEDGIVDGMLARTGQTRRVAVTVPSFAAATWFVAASDLITTLPKAIAAQAVERLKLVARPPPLKLPASEAYLWWHPRLHHDPGHAWWRHQLIQAFDAHRR